MASGTHVQITQVFLAIGGEERVQIVLVLKLELHIDGVAGR
jgi:hypothetical protein